MFKRMQIDSLHIHSTISELFLYEEIIEASSSAIAIQNIFNSDPVIPGVIIYENNNYLGIVTRNEFFESLSKPYGLELFTRRPIRNYIEMFGNNHLNSLSSSTLITTAVQKALERPYEKLNEPIIVEFENKNRKLLDIYQLHLAHSEINKIALVSLKEANDFKSELLSIAAHDLKNPLSSIIAYSKILRDLKKWDLDIQEMIDTIYDSSKHMTILISDLLNSTVIHAGKVNLKKQIINLDELTTAIIYQNKPIAELKNQIITYNAFKYNEYLIEGDNLKIRECIENILSNAIKYSPFNTEILINLTNEFNVIVLSIKDNGPGFTSEDKEKIFNKFQRLSAQPTGGESSTGLGLYIVKQIINSHGAQIRFDSEFGKGSVFFLEFQALNCSDNYLN
jgi:signal transduction histidine kinase